MIHEATPTQLRLHQERAARMARLRVAGESIPSKPHTVKKSVPVRPYQPICMAVEYDRARISDPTEGELKQTMKLLKLPRVGPVLAEVSRKHTLAPELVASKSRRKPVVRARSEVFARLYDQGLSSAMIGHYFDMDHTTVLYGIRSFRERGVAHG